MNASDKRRLTVLLVISALLIIAIAVLMTVGSKKDACLPSEIEADLAECGTPTSVKVLSNGNIVAFYKVDGEVYRSLTDKFNGGVAEYELYTAVLAYDADTCELSVTAIKK